MSSANEAPDTVRLDVWLDVACLFRTRSEAQHGCRAGRIEVNDQPAKAHRPIRPGDRIRIARPLGRQQTIEVRALADRHLPRAEARALYVDLTPKPTPEEIERRRLDRTYRAAMQAAGRPDKRQRRALRRLKERS